jgi:hypothetical protein
MRAINGRPMTRNKALRWRRNIVTQLRHGHVLLHSVTLSIRAMPGLASTLVFLLWAALYISVCQAQTGLGETLWD